MPCSSWESAEFGAKRLATLCYLEEGVVAALGDVGVESEPDLLDGGLPFRLLEEFVQVLGGE